MRSMRVSLAALVCAVVVTTSCGLDAPTAARTPLDPSNDLLGLTSTTSSLLGTLLKCQKLPYASGSQVIGPAGGQIQIGPHTLTVPAGALTTSVLISGEAPSSNENLVQLYPEGLQFAKPVALTMSYAHCSLVVGLLPRVAYVDDKGNILSYFPSLANLLAKTVTGQVPHFSGYATAW